MVHKPKHNVHSFRGLLGDGGQDEINLERQNVNLAYRVVKFEIIGNNPGTIDQMSTVQIFREIQSSASGTIDFSDPDLLGAAYYQNKANPNYTHEDQIIFDNVLFSRNIFVTHVESNGTESCNYYIELEEVPVTASALMQLKLQVARKLNLQQD